SEFPFSASKYSNVEDQRRHTQDEITPVIMMRATREGAGLLLLLAAVVTCHAATCNLDQRPNIVFVLMDDCGWGDVDWNDPFMRTPNIRAIKEEGRSMTNAYSLQLCSPSRSALLTGKYPHTYGLQVNRVFDNNLNWLPENLKLVSQELKELDYKTHMLGKWHLGFCDWDLTPLGRGFDTFYGKVKGNSNYFTHSAQYQDIDNYYDFFDQTRNVPEAYGKYSTNLFSERAVEIVQSHQGPRPFYIYLAYQTGHIPFQVPEYYVDTYCSHIEHRPRQIYCAMMAAADEGIGNITTALKNKGIYDNTIFIVTSDNGAEPWNRSSSNWPLRGGKVTLFEGGTRVFSVIKAPGIVNNIGNDWDGIFHETDWYPTLVEAACGTPPSSVDGVSQYQQIMANQPGPRETMLYNIERVGGYVAVRNNRYKLIRGATNKLQGWYPPVPMEANGAVFEEVAGDDIEWGWKLYDLTVDPNERNNIYSGNENLQDVLDLKALISSEESRLVSAQSGGQSPTAIGIRNQLGHWNPGWCSVDPLPGVCNPDPCQNGGTCFQEDYTYRCACPLRASGTHCETLIACIVPELTRVNIENIQSVQSSGGVDTVTPTDPSTMFTVQYDVSTLERCTMESVTFKLLEGDAKSVQMELFDGPEWNDDGYVYMPKVNRDIEMTLPYMLAQVGNKVRFSVVPNSGTTNIKLVVINVGLCTGPPLSNRLDTMQKTYSENADYERTDSGDFITAIDTNVDVVATYERTDGQEATFKSVTFNLIGGTGTVWVYIVTETFIEVDEVTQEDIAPGQNVTFTFSDQAVGKKLRFLARYTSARRKRQASSDFQLQVTDMKLTAPLSNRLDTMQKTYSENADYERTDSGDFITAIDTNVDVVATYERTDGQEATFKSVTFNLIGGTGTVWVYIVTETFIEVDEVTQEDIAPGQNVTFTFSDQAVGKKLRFLVRYTSARRKRQASSDFQLQVTDMKLTAPLSNRLDTMQKTYSENADYERTDSGDFITAIDTNIDVVATYERTDGQVATFKSVTFNLIGGTGTVWVYIVTETFIEVDEVTQEDIAPGQNVTFTFSDQAVGKKLRFLVRYTSARRKRQASSDFQLQVTDMKLTAVCQPANLAKVYELNVASVTEANGERTVTPTDPASVFKVVYEVDPKETATFTRVTYRVNGAAPQKVLTTVFNHPDTTTNGSSFDNTFTVGQDKVVEYSPLAFGTRIRFTITPTATTTAIQFVIVSMETCQGATGQGGPLTTWLTNAPTSKPNVLFIVSDDLRPWMGCYGVDFMVTPNLDLLASKSVRFDSAYVQHAICGPSRASFMTGRRSDSTRVMNLVDYWRTVGGNFTTVSQYFMDNGYWTEGVGKIYHSGSSSGNSEDYPFSWSTPLNRNYPTLKISDIKALAVRPVEEAGTGLQLQDTRIAEAAVAKLADYAQDQSHQPFFLAVGFKKPHLPFLFPEEYMDLYPNPMDIPLAVNRDLNTNLPGIVWTNFGELQNYGDIAALNLNAENNYRIADAKQYELRRGYAAATSYIDAMVGKVLQGLNDNGLASNTIIADWNTINTRELYIHDVDENGSDVDVEEHFNQVDNPNYSGVVAELAQKLRENWFVALQDYHNQGQN
ncbi:hypothetical protein BaRGS_00019698, partial [Batillaria attramentaria]